MGLGKRADGVHPAGLAKKVRDANGTGLGRHGRGQLSAVHVEGVQLGLDQNRAMARPNDGQDGGDVGVGGHQDVGAGWQVQSLDRQDQRIQTIGHANAVLGAHGLSKFGLEG